MSVVPGNGATVAMETTVYPTEYTGQVTWSPGLAIFLAVIACFGTIGNLCVIAAVCLYRKLRMRGNVFIVNLAVADLLVTAYIMPVGIATSQYKLKPFSDALCDFNAFLMLTTFGLTTQSLMLIAVERYIHVCKLSWYHRLFTPKLIAFYVVLVWICTMIWAMQGWTNWTHYYYGHDYFLCFFYGPASISYDICLTVFGFVLPILILIFCYASIFKVVRASRVAMQSHQTGSSSPKKELYFRKQQIREHKFIMMMAIIVVVFFVCWAPGACVMALSGALGENQVPVLAYTVTIWIALCNSAMNSTIYGTMNNNFKRAYIQIARKVFCCCFKNNQSKCVSKSTSSQDNAFDCESNIASSKTHFSHLPRRQKAMDTNTELSSLPRSPADKNGINRMKY